MAKPSYGGSYDFPLVDFSAIGDLPSALEQGRIRAARMSLGDLTSADPASLDAAAAKLIAGGDIEGGKTLLAASTAQKGVAIRGANEAAMAEYTKNILPLLPGMLNRGAGGAATEPYVPETLPPADTGGTALRPFPTTPPVPQGTIGPQSAVAPPQALAAAAPGQINIPPSPEAGQLSAALAPPSAVPSQALAGPVQSMTQPGLEPAAPPPPAFDPRFSPTPGGLEPLAPPPPRPAGVSPIAPYKYPLEDQRAIQDATQAARDMIIAGQRGAPPGIVAEFKLRYQDALARTKLSTEMIQYRVDQAQRRVDGLPEQSRQEWANTNKLLTNNYGEMQKLDATIQEKGQQGREIKDNISVMRQILKQPNFDTGRTVETQMQLTSAMGALYGAARNLGIPTDALPDINQLSAMKSTQLGEVFRALSNKVVLASLGGSLGKQISDSDRNFLSVANPSLLLTKKGNELLMDVYDRAATVADQSSRIALDYRERMGNNATAVGMRRAILNYADANPILMGKNGKLTALGGQINAELVRGGGKSVKELLANPETRGTIAQDVINAYGSAKDLMGQAATGVGNFISQFPNQFTGPAGAAAPPMAPTQAAPVVAPAAPAPVVAPPPAAPGPVPRTKGAVAPPAALPPGARRVIHSSGARGIQLLDGRIIPVQ